MIVYDPARRELLAADQAFPATNYYEYDNRGVHRWADVHFENGWYVRVAWGWEKMRGCEPATDITWIAELQLHDPSGTDSTFLFARSDGDLSRLLTLFARLST